ncbi:hypothetical protein A5904_07680 [Acidithiobacillus caldus]|uniref:hypothetical protein n=1 Tax=Acidithiobacillus caldus TaxID=33059 RepID=UPI0007DA1FD0|nr:hypothetical protein [Acidithiobacillus caldus]AUW32846.1 hypothetical protein A5904_07680 [Acidithiobacillus caldus]QER45445.1 hypothetical protein F0726_02390 [Acidithiobacillus caldus]
MIKEFFEGKWFVVSLVVGFLLLTVLPHLGTLFDLFILFIVFGLAYIWDLIMFPTRVERAYRRRRW